MDCSALRNGRTNRLKVLRSPSRPGVYEVQTRACAPQEMRWNPRSALANLNTANTQIAAHDVSLLCIATCPYGPVPLTGRWQSSMRTVQCIRNTTVTKSNRLAALKIGNAIERQTTAFVPLPVAIENTQSRLCRRTWSQLTAGTVCASIRGFKHAKTQKLTCEQGSQIVNHPYRVGRHTVQFVLSSMDAPLVPQQSTRTPPRFTPRTTPSKACPDSYNSLARCHGSTA